MAEESSRLRRGPSVRVSLAIGFIGTVVIVLIGVAGPYLKQATTPHPATDPRFVAARSLPVQAAAPPVAVSSTPPVPATDDRGFVNSFARCDGPQTLVALGRTESSAVAICATADKQYVYKGVRPIRGTSLSVGGVTVTADGFEARNEDIVYRVSPRELVITSGDSVLTREPMVAYEARR